MKFAEMKDQAEKTGALNNLTPAFFVFSAPGAGFCGRLKHIAEVSSGLSEGVYKQYLFETDDGLIKCAFGSSTDKEVEALLKISNVYIVEFQGKAKITGGRSVNKFKIQEIDESGLIPDADKKDVPF